MGLRNTVRQRVAREVTNWKLATRVTDRAVATDRGASTRDAAMYAIKRTPAKRSRG
jgi:hypothetical protein